MQFVITIACKTQNCLERIESSLNLSYLSLHYKPVFTQVVTFVQPM